MVLTEMVKTSYLVYCLLINSRRFSMKFKVGSAVKFAIFTVKFIALALQFVALVIELDTFAMRLL